jgi:hypothetical protein
MVNIMKLADLSGNSDSLSKRKRPEAEENNLQLLKTYIPVLSSNV